MKKRIYTPKAQMQTAPSGEELKAWRATLKWTQEDAAKWLGVKTKAYQNWEQGARRMRHPVGMRRLMSMAKSKYAS